MPLPNGWSLRSLSVLYVASAFAGGYFLAWVYVRTHVVMTPQALIQQRPFGSKIIRWSEIREIRRHGRGFHVVGGDNHNYICSPFLSKPGRCD
jgi:hypothetical protein